MNKGANQVINFLSSSLRMKSPFFCLFPHALQSSSTIHTDPHPHEEYFGFIWSHVLLARKSINRSDIPLILPCTTELEHILSFGIGTHHPPTIQHQSQPFYLSRWLTGWPFRQGDAFKFCSKAGPTSFSPLVLYTCRWGRERGVGPPEG